MSVSVSVVNGYLCYSSCDAAKARAGKDPHPKPGENEQTGSKPDAGRPPAVVFGGALSDRAVTPVNAAVTADGASLNAALPTVDLLA